MPTREKRPSKYEAPTKSSRNTGGVISKFFAPGLNPNYGRDQEEANIEAGKNVDTANLYNSPTTLQRIFAPQQSMAADAFNAEAALRQALTKQAFNNSIALQKMQDEAAMARQAVGDKAALERALAIETARSKAQRESNLETATFNEGIAQREAMRQANLKEDELARQERDLSAKGRAIWDSSARGELPYTLNPDVNPEDYATIARMAPAIFGKDFAESGMINQPVMASKRGADIATNVLAEKLASDPQVYAAKVGKLIAEQQIPVSKDTASFSASPLFNDFIGNRTVTGKELVNMGGSMIPMDVTRDFPARRLPSDADRRATVERDYQEAMAKKAASAPTAPATAESERKPMPVSKRPFGTYAPPLDMEQSGLIPSMGRAITRQGQMAKDVFLTPPDYMTVAGDWWKKFLFGNPAVRSKQQ